MTKGKPWDIEEERQLRYLFGEGKSVDQIAKIMVKTRDAVLNKIYDLGLQREEEDKAHSRQLSSSFKKPEELPSVEESLKTLAAALKALEQPGLDQGEVLRLRSLMSGLKIYKELYADYLDFAALRLRC